MRLGVTGGMTGQRGHGLKRAHLVGDEIFDFARGDPRHRTPAEIHQVGIARMRPHRDPPFLRRRDRAAHRLGVAGMEATGNIGGRYDIQHRGVVAHFPRAETFTQIRIQVDPHGGHFPALHAVHSSTA